MYLCTNIQTINYNTDNYDKKTRELLIPLHLKLKFIFTFFYQIHTIINICVLYICLGS